jgi:hypothetical protein
MARLMVREPLSEGPATLFASTIVFLRGDLDVPSRRIADAFGITEANVNTIRSRGSAALGDPGLELLLRPETALTHSAAVERYGIRPVGTTRSPRRPSVNMEAAAAELAATVAVYKASQEYLRGAQALHSMRERIGYPRHPRFLRLIARLHAARCWFFCHSGFGVSALREAALAVPLLNYLYVDSRDPATLCEMRDCYLAASNASLLRRRPATARLLLEKAGQISERLNNPPGWEWVRQQATACFQLEETDMADRLYRRTAELSSGVDAAANGFPGRRHLLLLHPAGWEEMADHLRETAARTGSSNLEYSVQLHWTAAAGISADSAADNRRALELLDGVPARLFHSFGHQATVNHLLRLTSRLNLPPPARARWVRFAMYENAFRDH